MVQPSSAPRCRRQASPNGEAELRTGAGRSGAGRPQAGAEVASLEQRVGGHEQDCGGEQRGEHQPEPVRTVGTDLLGPAEEGQPDEVLAGSAGRVGGGAQDEGQPQHAHRDAAGTARRRGQLDGDGGDAGHDQAGHHLDRAERERTGAADPGGHQAQRRQQAGGEHRDAREGDGCREGRAPAHDAGGEQLEPAVLLLAAGVSTHQGEGEEGGREAAQHDRLEHPDPGRGGRGERAVESGQRRVVDHGRRPAGSGGVGGVEVEGRHHRAVCGGHQGQDAGHDDPPVSAPGQPQERAGAGEAAPHADTSSLAAGSGRVSRYCDRNSSSSVGG